MRELILLVVLAGCPAQQHDGDPCKVDGDCGDDVCARTDKCEPSDTLRPVHVTWTVSGAAPTAASCASLGPDMGSLQIDFEGQESGIAFAPVPCIAGLFSIDKLPDDLDQVFLGPEASSFAAQTIIHTDGSATLDL